MLTHAPVAFITTGLAIWFLSWWAIHRSYASRIDLYESRIRGLNESLEEYRFKLQVASPEEAARQLQSLHERVASLQSKTRPRFIPEEDAAEIASLLSSHAASTVKVILWHNNSQEVTNFAREWQKILTRAGWDVSRRIGLTISHEGIEVHSKEIGTPQFNAILRAVSILGITPQIKHEAAGEDGCIDIWIGYRDER
jgi:hypothetical protein